MQDNLLEKVGDTCAAWPLMMLVGALEEAKPGDRILVASYGQGVDVLLFKVTDKIGRMKDKWGIKKSLARRKELESWERFASMRGAVKFYLGPRDQEYGFTSYSMAWRERKSCPALWLQVQEMRHGAVPAYGESASTPTARPSTRWRIPVLHQDGQGILLRGGL